MYDFIATHSIYIVFFVVLIIWLGLGSYFFKVDSKLNKLEKAFEELKESKS